MFASGIVADRCNASVSASTEPPVAMTKISMPWAKAMSRRRAALVRPPTRFNLIPNTSANPSRAIRAPSCNVTSVSSTLTAALCRGRIAAISSNVSQGCSNVTQRSVVACMTCNACQRVQPRLQSYRMISFSGRCFSTSRMRAISR